MLKRFSFTLLVVGATVFASSHAEAVLSPGDIVAWYRLNGDAMDNSGNGAHGVNSNTAFVADGVRGTVGSFNGSNSSINVSASGYSVTSHPNLEFSVSFWVKPTARQDYVPGNANIDYNPVMGGTGSTRGVIEIVGDGSWPGMSSGSGVAAYGGVGINSGGGAGDTGKVPSINIYDGDWHHVLIQWVDQDGTVNGGSGWPAQVYIDGILGNDVTTQSYNGQNGGTAAPQFVLGGPVVASIGTGGKYYDGLLSDVVFFNRQLTAGEVLEAMNLGNAADVPEPATASLLVLGALAVTRRRRRTA